VCLCRGCAAILFLCVSVCLCVCVPVCRCVGTSACLSLLKKSTISCKQDTQTYRLIGLFCKRALSCVRLFCKRDLAINESVCLCIFLLFVGGRAALLFHGVSMCLCVCASVCLYPYVSVCLCVCESLRLCVCSCIVC